MARITNLEQKTYMGKPQGFKVTLDDGRTGNLEEKQSDKGLRVNDEVIVTEIPYTSKAGKQSTLYGLRLNTQGASQSQSHTPSPTPPNNPPKVIHSVNIAQMKFDARMKVTELAIGGLFGGKFKSTDEAEEAKAFVASWVSFTDGLIDEIFTGK